MNGLEELMYPKIPHEASHLVNKHSWRGKYKRIFTITKSGVQTINNSSWELTNAWSWMTEVIEAYAEKKSTTEFVLSVRDGKKTENTTFSSDERADILTDFMLTQNSVFQAALKTPTKMMKEDFQAFKIKRGDARRDVILRVRDYGIEELDSVTKAVRTTYLYKDIHSFSPVTDVTSGFSIQCPKGCPHVYMSAKHTELVKLMQTTAQHRIGVTIENFGNVTQVQCRDARIKFHGGDEDDESISVVEFNINKVSPRYEIAVPRIFCLTERRIVERDPSTYSIVTTRPLSNIYCVVRHTDDGQRFTIQYYDGSRRTYVSTLRDAVVSSILDASRGVGNASCHVSPLAYERGYSLAPLHSPADFERELLYLKLLAAPDIASLAINNLGKVATSFNSNVPYTNAQFTDKNQKYVHAAINNLLPREMEFAEEINPMVVVAVLQALRRLFATRTGFEAVSQVPGLSARIVKTLNASMRVLNEHINYAATEVIASLIQPAFEATEASDSTHEQMNKRVLFPNEETYESLIKFIEYHGMTKTGALVVNGTIDIFVYMLCQPYSDTTDGQLFDKILDEVAKLGRILFKLFHHPCLTVTKGVGMLMSAIINESSMETAQKIQYASLLEGALLRHLHAAIFTNPRGDPRQIMQRNLSRELVRLWTASNERCMATMKRTFPPGLLLYLSQEDAPPVDEEEQAALNARRKKSKVQHDTFSLNPFTSWHMRKVTKRRAAMPKATIRAKRQQMDMKFENWAMVFHQIKVDHCRHDLIWNHYTREELREYLDTEIRNFMQDQEMAGDEVLSWNHTEFEVHYASLAREPKVGDYYLRLLLEGEKGKNFQLQDPVQFFNELYQRFFHETDIPSKALCLQCLAVVYRANHEQIGRFREIQYVIQMLGEVRDLLIRDRLLQFISSLILNVDNAKAFVDCRGVPLLVNLLTLVHLETQKTVTPLQGNYIMAGEGQVRESEKEWYFCGAHNEREGPLDLVQVNELWKESKIHAKTLMWAIGMDDWSALENIPQLRWTLVATGQSVLTYTQLGVLCLDMILQITSLYPSRDEDNSIIRPMPRAKRQLCEPNCFPHIIQVLLTYDPELVDRVSRLLVELIRDNISVLPKIYLTGIFYFCLLYPGSNVLPISRLLKITHNKQNYIAGDTGHGSLYSRSFLKTILPEAMVCFLTNYEADKFSEIYLGEFDTPESIWNHEMRRRMMEKIAIHIGNFPIRLQTNTRSLYQFVPMAPISYPELENELFCNMYYLRHLCNTQKFPNWPIVNHIDLLQAILVEWKNESEKKGSPISKEEAYETLGIKPSDAKSEDVIRKAYYKLASKYHPDKNPEGRDIFEKIQKAYEVLSSTTNTEGPDPDRLILLMKAQVILYSRYPEVLQPFRYAGYPMLLSIIVRENTNDQLFSQKTALLPHAIELCYYTVSVSPLNAEEVRREGGVEVLATSLQRCVEVLTLNVTFDSMPAQVCSHALRAFSVLGSFQPCREAIANHRSITFNAVRCLNYTLAPVLLDAAMICTEAFAVDATLQEQLVQSGLLWLVIASCFKYDYTLEESGVEVTAETNVQHLRNNVAKRAISVLARMGGYRTGSEATPKNELVRHSLNALITPYMVARLGDPSPLELLRLLNTNNENPFSIWHNETRGELLDYLEKQSSGLYRSGTHDPNNAPNFVFKVLKEELYVGGIYIRVYNQQPKTPLPTPNDTLREFLEYLRKKGDGVDFRSTGTKDADYWRMLKSAGMVIQSIKNVLTNHFGAEAEFARNNNIRLMCSFLDVVGDDSVPLQALEVVNILTASTACISGLTEAECMLQLLPLLIRIPTSRDNVMNILHKLIANSKMVNEIAQHGGLLYLLDIYFNGTDFAIRSTAASVVAKMAIDKVYGPKLTILMAKLFPPPFLVAMREDPNSAVHMFDNNHETPELIWNDSSRKQAQSAMNRMAQEFYARKESKRTEIWSMPERFSVIYEDAEAEISVGGVFLRLFLKQPTWAIRNPRQFLTELLDKFLTEVAHMQINENLELLAQATVALLRAQPTVGDSVASTGHLPKLFPLLEHADRNVRMSTSLILLSLCESQACVDILVNFNWMRNVISGIRSTPETAVALVEIFSKSFSKSRPEKGSLIPQAQTVQLPEFLMALIEKEANAMPNAAQIKAVAINTLKTMTYDRVHGEAIARLLDSFPAWASYRDQRHDLFLTSGGAVGLLTGPTTAPTLLLTNASANYAPPPRNLTAPPPVTERK